MTHLIVSDDPAATAADLFSSAIQATLRVRGSARVAISGGSALAAWVAAATELGDALRNIRLTWVDERCVSADDAASNRGEAHRRSKARPDELPLWLDDETVDEPERALKRVRLALRDDFEDALDVTLLGMGPDGHIASLFPGTTGSWAEGDRVVFVPDSPKPPAARITLSRPLLATASMHVLLATGEAKRDALRRVLAGDPSLPATGLPELTIVTDLENLLPRSKEPND